MVNTRSIVYFDKKSVADNINSKIKSIRDFTSNELKSKNVRSELIRKLGFYDNDYWKELKNEVLRHFKKNTYVIIKNLPFDNNDKLSMGLSSFIGTPIMQYNKGIPHMVNTITPRTGQRYDENFPHTDSSYWIKPNDVLALQCVSEDQNKLGKSRIIPIDLLVQSLKDKGFEDVIRRMIRSKVPFSLDPRYGKGLMHKQHILTHRKIDKKYHVRFLRHEILYYMEKYNVRLNKDTVNALKIFEEEAIKLGRKNQFLINKGDWVLIDNKRSLHSRSPTSVNSTRCFKRIKLNITKKILNNLKLN